MKNSSRVSVPKPRAGASLHIYKISKRVDQDISALCGAFHLGRDFARIAFGGMAATPKRALHAEKALMAQGLDAALAALEKDFTPLSDMRASAAYRMETAKALLKKAMLERQGADISQTRVLEA